MTDKQIAELVGIVETALMGAEPTSALSPLDALYKLHDEIDRLRGLLHQADSLIEELETPNRD